MKYLPGGTGLREGSPPLRVPRQSQALLQGITARTGESFHQYCCPQLCQFAGQTGGQTAESSGPSQYPGPAGLGEMKILEGSGGGEGAEVPSTWEAEDKDLD